MDVNNVDDNDFREDILQSFEIGRDRAPEGNSSIEYPSIYCYICGWWRNLHNETIYNAAVAAVVHWRTANHEH